MHERTLTAMYDTHGAAETARDELVSLGVSSSQISIHGEGASTTSTTTTETEDRGFWASLSDAFFPDEDRHVYSEGLRRGGYLLTASVPDELEEQAADILERGEPVDLDTRSQSWRESGWTGETVGTGMMSGGAGIMGGATPGLAEAPATDRLDVATTRTTTAATAAAPVTARATDVTGDETIQLMEEQLRVGKRDVGRGSVRVRSYVVERPVEEQVTLHDERVRVERRPVDRELTSADTAAFTDRTIEATERVEEAVVSKTARVVEEIALSKDASQRTETVRDTVRKTEVEVEDNRTGHGLAETGARTGLLDDDERLATTTTTTTRDSSNLKR